MALSSKGKKLVIDIIVERAYEIAESLSADNFFKAHLAGIRPENVKDVSLQCALIEIKKEFAPPGSHVSKKIH